MFENIKQGGKIDFETVFFRFFGILT